MYSRLNMSTFCSVPEVFFLFRLFDFDRTGLLDGLEMMQLLTDYNSRHTPGTHANEQVRRAVCVHGFQCCSSYMGHFVSVCM